MRSRFPFVLLPFAVAGVLVAGAFSPAAALHVVSPAPGSTVTPGQLVTLRIALDGESVTDVGVLSDGAAVPATLSGNGFEAQVRIPREAVGGDVLVGYAVLAGGGTAFARVDVNVDPGPLQSLFVSVVNRLTFAGQVVPVEVKGLFADGVLRDLRAPDLGTTYTSSAPAVLAADPTGLVQARSNGTATVQVSSRGKSRSVRVQVVIPQGATNAIPTLDVGADQNVAAEQLVTLEAIASDADGDTLEYIWEQVGGRVVTLRNARAAQPVFVSPRSPTQQLLEFLVSVRDSKGATTLPRLVRVTVSPAPPPVGN